jgi:hypothetical protein
LDRAETTLDPYRASFAGLFTRACRPKIIPRLSTAVARPLPIVTLFKGNNQSKARATVAGAPALFYDAGGASDMSHLTRQAEPTNPPPRGGSPGLAPEGGPSLGHFSCNTGPD